MLDRLLICAIVYIYFLIHLTCGQRRIVNGSATNDKRYVVYFVKAETSPQKYDAWLCGGAIVSPLYIVTSAACVEDVQHMYAIAGYKHYVRTEQLDQNPCTKVYKKKVVYVCLPQAYNLEYPDVEKWAWVDIAVVKVESPYNFGDDGYLKSCSYTPSKIDINYDKRYQEPGVDALVLGWGHTHKWRSVSDSTDYNNDELLGASVMIQDKETCKMAYGSAHPKLLTLIDKYMICTMTQGNINSRGEIIKTVDLNTLTDGCGPLGLLRAKGLCDNDTVIITDNMRKNYNLQKNGTEDVSEFLSRRHGICQNDHGGPLVTWVGAQEMLIGVASVFRINSSTSECIGPYLFTSTWCSSAFLNCVIEQNGRRSSCDRPAEEQGFTLIERDVTWYGHPHGPAVNENVQMRPQLPLHGI